MKRHLLLWMSGCLLGAGTLRADPEAEVGIRVLSGAPVQMLVFTNAGSNATMSLEWCDALPNGVRLGTIHGRASCSGLLFGVSSESIDAPCGASPLVTNLVVESFARFKDEVRIFTPLPQFFLRYSVVVADQPVTPVGPTNFIGTSTPSFKQNDRPLSLTPSENIFMGVVYTSRWSRINSGSLLRPELILTNTYRDLGGFEQFAAIYKLEIRSYGQPGWTTNVTLESACGWEYPLEFVDLGRPPCALTNLSFRANYTVSANALVQPGPPGIDQRFNKSLSDSWSRVGESIPAMTNLQSSFVLDRTLSWLDLAGKMDLNLEFEERDVRLGFDFSATNQPADIYTNLRTEMFFGASYEFVFHCPFSICLTGSSVTNHTLDGTGTPRFRVQLWKEGTTGLLFTNQAGVIDLAYGVGPGAYTLYVSGRFDQWNYTHWTHDFSGAYTLSLFKVRVLSATPIGPDLELELDLMEPSYETVIEKYVDPVWQEVDRFTAISTVTNHLLIGAAVDSNAQFRAYTDY
ncbi:MAG: hypothetical protein AAF492_02205 [Verrucomicrobiota bacterium]